MSANIEFEGVEEILSVLAEDGYIDDLTAKLGKACAMVERSAKQKAPKDTGALRNSITSEVNGTEGKVFTPLMYAPYVEYGTGLFAEKGGRTDVPWVYQDDKGEWHSTRGQKPQPFMRPAINENREAIMRLLKEGLLND